MRMDEATQTIRGNGNERSKNHDTRRRPGRPAARMGFAFFADSLDYLIAGAIIVVPLFILSRLLRFGGRRRAE